MTTDLGALTTAADRWDGMAGEFAKQEKAYRRDVHGISMGTGWIGLSADAANRRFDITLKEFAYAQTEAKAVAGLLRDAHTQFVELRSRVKTARQEAIDAGMKVSEQTREPGHRAADGRRTQNAAPRPRMARGRAVVAGPRQQGSAGRHGRGRRCADRPSGRRDRLQRHRRGQRLQR
ncbi:hypothetical protein ABZS59_03375 [Streptomyces flaveolus]|uniref:hypothetical protein n=1 Tax=Streptomyces flaveolus TaxID=67297 RepID=UPI0033AF4B4B